MARSDSARVARGALVRVIGAERPLLPVGLAVMATVLLLATTAATARSALVGAPFASPSASSTFDDEFDGSSIDSTLWNTDVATSGNRFCNDSPDSDTGVWTDISSDPSCHGVLVSPPYASVTEGGGLASFSAPPGHAFGYLVAGPPSRHPFPSAGDFTLELRMRYDVSAQDGDGVMVQSTDNADPVGTNSPLTGRVLQVWNDPGGVGHVALLGDDTTVADASAFHDYRLEYAGGAYSLFVDGALVKGPIASSIRPSTIWLGHPDAVWWGSSPWSAFSVDFIRVTTPRPGPPPGEVGVLINGGDYATNNPHVALDIVWPQGATQVFISNDAGFDAAGNATKFPLAAQIPWTLKQTGTDPQRKTIYVRFLGASEDLLTFTDDIILDETAPSVESASLLSGGPKARVSAAGARIPRGLQQYRLKIKATDTIVGICALQVSTRQAPGTTTAIIDCDRRGFRRLARVVTVLAAGRPQYVRVRNSAGTWSRWLKIGARASGRS
jgi:hypothetical protein